MHFGPKLNTLASRSTLHLRLSPEQALVFVVLRSPCIRSPNDSKSGRERGIKERVT